ncbi:uncharacterized protein BDR25DRAFT_306560 [Lindgomyces ingoldianus]|uniref:Uncharacterized protein n=1 Tax=Lindgomyces ingoldianus TaxID=673940 RepID=A0ACB6QFL9_9PLEO|nr:uncharacterized protein BDR25DRAFT_306560 [Lindgomyces ingoldianus]KAF2465824.1 hypothetical protein BDR25DRAFT_306560 [Lindgomyces ingoldianus]
MNIVGYSDSEGSDNDAPAPPQPTVKPTPKMAFQKVVDRTNPGTIKLNLPSAAGPHSEKDGIEAGAPPAKKVRTGGAFGGFNAMLPAPKKAGATLGTTEEAAPAKKLGVSKSKPSFTSMKTGAEPMFCREPKEPDYDEAGNPVKKDLTTPSSSLSFTTSEQRAEQLKKSDPGIKFAGRNSRFMPLSAARRNKNKRPIPYPSTAPTNPKPATPSLQPQPAAAVKLVALAKKKVSLFSASQDEVLSPTENPSSGEYQPLFYGADEGEDAKVPDQAVDEIDGYQPAGHIPSAALGASAGAQDLTNIATELHLSEAEKRQLFGRKGRGDIPGGAKIVEFNTDREYAHNEELRAQGETVQHNALKSISGTGKNSLKSLINVATTQKDALEDHFAQGRRNRKEAGNKYGW